MSSPRTPSRLRTLAGALIALTLAAAACSSDDSTESEGRATTPSTSDESDGPASIELRDDSLRADVFADGLDQPTSLAVLDDGRLLVTEKASGKVRIIDDGKVTDDALDLAVNSFDERGLLGITLHPEFATEPFVYLHWTWRGDGDGSDKLLGDDSEEATEVPTLGNRIDRFRWADDELSFDLNVVSFPSNTLDTDTSNRVRGNHDAGPLAFGPDGKLYVMMGDQNQRSQMQNLPEGPAPDDAHLSGVILRLNDDGTAPADNPFAGEAAARGGEVGENLAKVWAYGVRNGFGLAFEPDSGALWQTENGDDSWDEINVFEAGSNSGWIQLQGPPERFDEYKELEVASEDGLDNPDFDPSALAADADAAQAAMTQVPGARYTAPVLSYRYPPALTAIGFVVDDSLGERSTRTAWVGTVLTDSLLRYPLSQDGRSLVLEGPLADGVDDNAEKGDLGESADHVVGTGFGVITDIEHAPDGSLYVVSISTGQVIRLRAA